MALLGQKLGYLGVDLGASSIKMVELKKEGGRAKLVTYGFAEQPLSEIGTFDPRDNIEKTAALLADIHKKSKAKSNQVIAALPTFAVFSSIISLPEMGKKEMQEAIKIEAAKLVNRPIDEMVIDWKKLQANESEEPAKKIDFQKGEVDKKEEKKEEKEISSTKKGTARILLTAAPKDLVKKYVEIFQKAKLQLVSLETEAFALVRSLVGNDRSSVMIVDIGATNTDISIISQGIPVLNRSINVGGISLTKLISENLSLPLDQAEQFKRDVGVVFDKDSKEVPPSLKSTLTPLVNEISYSKKLFLDQNIAEVLGVAPKVEKIILTGGSAFLHALPTYLSTTLDIKTFVGDPWARVSYPDDLRPILDQIGTRLSVATGLAMRDIY